jgi:hypothetical protein
MRMHACVHHCALPCSSVPYVDPYESCLAGAPESSLPSLAMDTWALVESYLHRAMRHRVCLQMQMAKARLVNIRNTLRDKMDANE